MRGGNKWFCKYAFFHLRKREEPPGCHMFLQVLEKEDEKAIDTNNAFKVSRNSMALHVCLRKLKYYVYSSCAPYDLS